MDPSSKASDILLFLLLALLLLGLAAWLLLASNEEISEPLPPAVPTDTPWEAR